MTYICILCLLLSICCLVLSCFGFPFSYIGLKANNNSRLEKEIKDISVPIKLSKDRLKTIQQTVDSLAKTDYRKNSSGKRLPASSRTCKNSSPCQHIMIHLYFNGTRDEVKNAWCVSCLTMFMVFAAIAVLLNWLHNNYKLGVYYVNVEGSTNHGAVVDHRETDPMLGIALK